MRILVVTNFYPPYHIGGYELGCSRVVEALRVRGHHVKVLTSVYGVGSPRNEKDIYRQIPINIRFKTNRSLKRLWQFWRFDRTGRKVFREVLGAFRPEVIYIWNMVHLPISIVFQAQVTGVPVHFYVSDRWLANWDKDGWFKIYRYFNRSCMPTWMGKIFRLFFPESAALFDRGLRLDHVQCVSRFIRDDFTRTGKKLGPSNVVPWGVDVSAFSGARSVKRNVSKLLYVGQIVEHKGLHIVIEALHILLNKHGFKNWEMAIVGGSTELAYLERLKNRAAACGLKDHLRWLGFCPSEQLPGIYKDHDVLVFSSIWEEPFSITLVEALASGLGVVTTMTGGTSEIVRPDINALVYQAQDPADCARQILRLVLDRHLLETICRAGRKSVEEHFRFESMIDKIENELMGRESTHAPVC